MSSLLNETIFTNLLPSLFALLIILVTVLVPFTQFYAEKDTPFEVMIPISLLPAAGASTGGTGGGVVSGSTTTSPTSLDDEVVIVLSGTAYESSGMYVCHYLLITHSSPSHDPPL